MVLLLIILIIFICSFSFSLSSHPYACPSGTSTSESVWRHWIKQLFMNHLGLHDCHSDRASWKRTLSIFGMFNIIWLVVSTPLKNISQMGVLFPIYGKIIQMFQTTNQSSIPEVTWTVCKHLPYDPLAGLPRTHSSQASNWHSFVSFRWLRHMKLSPALCFNHHLQWDTLRKGSESHRP